MSLATRCPACGTIFRVVQDQLKVSEGWVRCGQCHEVFHGIEALFDLDSDPAVAARRAAARRPAAPPPTRVFADQRASAPIPMAVQTPPAPAPAPIAIPARPSAPVSTSRQSVAASPSAFGTSGLPPTPPSIRPGYTGFTPATRPMEPPPPSPPQSPPAPSPIAQVATRGTIAPRFAARLAEEAAARTQAAVPSPDSVDVPLADVPSMPPAAPAIASAPSWQAPAAPAPFPSPTVPPPVAEPAPRAFAPAPAPELAPAPAHVETPGASPIAAQSQSPALAEPSAADLASEFAAPAPLPAMPEAGPDSLPPVALEAAREPTPGTSAIMPSLPADDDADDPRAGPPTLASMLPEDAGEWPPRRTKKQKRPADSTVATSEIAIVDRTKDPRFLREARSGARWRRPWVRAVLSLALLLLVAVAAGQVAWPMRDTLAARWPVTLPAWDWLCEQADCKIEAPRAIASLALDGSSLTRTDTEHVLLFSADLHNRSDHEVRMPSFDVTFMDLNGEIVARKVLSPDQVGIHQASLPAEGDLHVHARLQVGTLAASGFQADLFYP